MNEQESRFGGKHPVNKTGPKHDFKLGDKVVVESFVDGRKTYEFGRVTSVRNIGIAVMIFEPTIKQAYSDSTYRTRTLTCNFTTPSEGGDLYNYLPKKGYVGRAMKGPLSYCKVMHFDPEKDYISDIF